MLRASREKENPRGGDLWGFLHVKTGMDLTCFLHFHSFILLNFLFKNT